MKKSDMTPLEAAEKLEKYQQDEFCETCVHHICKSCKGPCKSVAPFIAAASYLRAIAAGEYKRVVHAHITGHGYDLHCSNCGASADIGDDYCKSCGALMDGKDDSRVEK
jgi:predicted amidophosphoribosyltransferase